CGKSGSSLAPDSPFSTFGKAPEAELLSDPDAQLNEVSTGQESQLKRNNHSTGQGAHINQLSPTKFATISRSTPTRGCLRVSPSPRGQTTGSLQLCPVSSPRCPVIPSMGKFSSRPLPETPTHSRPLTETPTHSRPLPETPTHSRIEPGTLLQPSEGQHQDFSNVDREPLVHGWNLASNQSPVYACIKDAIPYSSGSPKYAEIDENGLPRIIPKSSEMKFADEESSAKPRKIFSSRQLNGDYCSLSTLSENRTSAFPTKRTVVTKKPSLNRRRSKSMEDIYAVPSRGETLFNDGRGLACFDEEFSSEGGFDPPPIPDRNFSPQSLFHSFLSLKNKRTTPHTPAVTKSPVPASPSSLKHSPQKRRSHEGFEAGLKKSPPKKVKAQAHSQDSSHETKSIQLEGSVDSADITETPKLSILTGSLKPTTRSAQRTLSRLDIADSSTTTNFKQAASLGALEVKQLQESPKFPRRKLKRRSSNLSTTPGKGLTFGKSSKMATPSPRRVSFAKDVKDSDSRSSPRRRSSSRRNVLPAAGHSVTRQTQDSLNFQSFLSSHSSPPSKGKLQQRETNVSKPSSPLKTSLTNLLSSLKRKPEENEVRSVNTSEESETNSGGSNRTLSEESSSDKRSPVKTKIVSQENLEHGGNLFPPSPTRQVGRRILGSPQSNKISQSNQISQVLPNHRKEAKLKEVNLFSVPTKPIHAFMSKLSSKTSILCAEEVKDSDGYSSSDDVANERSEFGSTKSTGLVSPSSPSHRLTNQPAHQLSTSRGEREDRLDTEQVSSGSPELRMTSPRSFTADPVLRFDMAPGEADQFTPRVKLDQSRSGDVKAFARVAKIWNRTVGFDATVDPFTRKSRLNTQVDGNKLLLGERTGSHFVDSASEKEWENHGESKTEARFILSSISTDSEIKSSTGIDNYEFREKESQFSAKLPNEPCERESESTPSERQAFIVPIELGIDHQEEDAQSDTSTSVQHLAPVCSKLLKEDINIYTISKNFNEANLNFPVTPNPEDEPNVEEKAQPIESFSYCEEPSFILPPYPEHLEVSSDDGSQLTEQISNSDSTSTHFVGPCTADQSFTLPPYPEVKAQTCEAGTHADLRSSLPSSSEVPPPLVDSECEESVKHSQINVCLQRIKSLKRASPKVVDNDSWITERRHGNRLSKSRRSSRSTFNQSLTPSSAKKTANIETSNDSPYDHQPVNPPPCADAPGELTHGFYASEKRSDTCHFSEVVSTEPMSMPNVEPGPIPNSEKTEAIPTTQTNYLRTNILSFSKPETIPSKAKTFAQKRLNIQNFINSSSSSPSPVPNRSSSLTKKAQASKAKLAPRENFITKNINALKKETAQSAAMPALSNHTSKHADKSAQSENLVNRENESEVNYKGRRSRSNWEHLRNKPVGAANKMAVFNQGDKVSTKRGSIGQDKRRRSKSNGVEEENHLTFSERRKFFQQLQANKPRPPVKVLRSGAQINTPRGQLDKLSQSKTLPGPTPRAVSRLKTTPQPIRQHTEQLGEVGSLSQH
ncbi:hypothetical protein EGW08_007159, partial [Elysia chlorotica]